MKTGRPTERQRPPFGERLYRLREQAGLTQAQIAESLGISSRAYAFWEREPVSLKPDQIEKLAVALKVAVEDLFGNGSRQPQRKGGPTGKVRQVFEKVNRLPRHQQNKVVEFVEAFVNQKSAAH